MDSKVEALVKAADEVGNMWTEELDRRVAKIQATGSCVNETAIRQLKGVDNG